MESGSTVDFSEQLPFMEPWRCEGPCGQLMYNINHKGYPAPGAPIGYNIRPSGKNTRVCALCCDMYVTALENPYMAKCHSEWMEEQTRIKEKLGSGKKYLDN